MPNKKPICSKCGGVWDNTNPLDMYDCENHAPAASRYNTCVCGHGKGFHVQPPGFGTQCSECRCDAFDLSDVADTAEPVTEDVKL